ncbi:MAG TPA: hypothetical protein VGD60_20340 [Candidatus Acidoferrales bacterium]
MESRSHKHEQGFGSILAMMITCAVILILLASLAPSTLKLTQTLREASAASQLATINIAEQTYAQTYGATVAPSFLAGNLATPASCSNSNLLSGFLVNQPPSGYSLTFTGVGTPTKSFTCSTGSVAGFAGYTINLDPSNALDAQRHFFTCVGSTCGVTNGLVTFAIGRPATLTDPTYAPPVNNNGSGNSSGTATAGNFTAQIYSPGTAYPLGAEVFRPSNLNGVSCVANNPSNNTCGPFFNVSGANTLDPIFTPNPDWSSFNTINPTTTGAGVYNVTSATFFVYGSNHFLQQNASPGYSLVGPTETLTANSSATFIVQNATFSGSLASINGSGDVQSGPATIQIFTGNLNQGGSIGTVEVNFNGQQQSMSSTGCTITNSGFTSPPYQGTVTANCGLSYQIPGNSQTFNAGIQFSMVHQ